VSTGTSERFLDHEVWGSEGGEVMRVVAPTEHSGTSSSLENAMVICQNGAPKGPQCGGNRPRGHGKKGGWGLGTKGKG
jgi:hypothetical protein